MADYYPLIARAIAGLDPSAPGESRRALYERARSALIAQLRSVQPPLSESEITRERLSLEEAVRKVESGAAQRARDAVLVLVGVGFISYKPIIATVSGLFKSSPVVEAPKDPSAPQSKPKIPDRVGQPSSSENVAPVAQRVVLYDE